jgi:hypothetical protein
MECQDSDFSDQQVKSAFSSKLNDSQIHDIFSRLFEAFESLHALANNFASSTELNESIVQQMKYQIYYSLFCIQNSATIYNLSIFTTRFANDPIFDSIKMLKTQALQLICAFHTHNYYSFLKHLANFDIFSQNADIKSINIMIFLILWKQRRLIQQTALDSINSTYMPKCLLPLDDLKNMLCFDCVHDCQKFVELFQLPICSVQGKLCVQLKIQSIHQCTFEQLASYLQLSCPWRRLVSLLEHKKVSCHLSRNFASNIILASGAEVSSVSTLNFIDSKCSEARESSLNNNISFDESCTKYSSHIDRDLLLLSVVRFVVLDDRNSLIELFQCTHH